MIGFHADKVQDTVDTAKKTHDEGGSVTEYVSAVWNIYTAHFLYWCDHVCNRCEPVYLYQDDCWVCRDREDFLSVLLQAFTPNSSILHNPIHLIADERQAYLEFMTPVDQPLNAFVDLIRFRIIRDLVRIPYLHDFYREIMRLDDIFDFAYGSIFCSCTRSFLVLSSRNVIVMSRVQNIDRSKTLVLEPKSSILIRRQDAN